MAKRTVLVELRLQRHVRSLSEAGQDEFTAVYEVLVEHGLRGLKIAPHWTAEHAGNPYGNPPRSFFEVKLRGTYMTLVAEERAEDVLILRKG